MNQWRGKLAIVTGASSGIGARIAEDLVKASVRVVAVARRGDRLEDLRQKLVIDKAPGELIPVQADVTDESQLLDVFRYIRENVPNQPVQILVNNAGVYRHEGLLDGNTDSWREILDTNVLATCILTRESVKMMNEHEVNGHVVFINSIAGHSIVAGSIGLYGPSKYAVTSLTETIRRELVSTQNRRIKISSVSPCLVDTEMNADLKENFLNNLPFLNPEDISNGVLYILGTPPHVQVQELTIKATGVPF